MNRWPTKKLGELLEIQNGFAFKSELFNEDGNGLPIIRIRDLTRGFSETFYDGEHDSAFEVENGDFLIGMDGEFRCYRWQGGKALLNQRVCRLQNFSRDLNAGYVFYGINDHLREIEDNTAFVTVKHVSSKQIASIEMSVLPLAEQKRIVRLLDEADKLRKLRTQADRRNADLIPALFHDMFGDPVTNPKGWPLRRFGDLCLSPPSNGIFKKVEEYGSGMPVVWVEQLYGDLRIDTTNCRRLRVSEKEVQKFGLRKGDLLFCRSSLVREGIGQVAYYDDADRQVLFECHVIRISPNLSLLSPQYVSAYFRTPCGKAQIIRVAKTATMTTIGQKDIVAITIPTPDLVLQKEFAARVSEIRAVQAEQSASRRRLDDLFQSLLHRAFNGEL